MEASWRLLAACALLLSASCAALPTEDPYIDLTRYFAFSASSTCGDPPSVFEFPVDSGQLQNCSGDDYAETFATDGDPTTRWQSANGETPVTLTFSLQQPALSLRLEGIRLRVVTMPPRYLYLEERLAGESSFTARRVYVRNETTECDGAEQPCSEYTVETRDSDEVVVLFCPLDLSEPVSEIRMRLDGYQDTVVNETSQYNTVAEAELLGWVANGYFAHSLTALSVEGETGFQLDSLLALDQPVPTSTDEALMPGFSSRGFAVISVNSTSQINVQWTFSPFSNTTSYQMWLRYSNPGSIAARSAMIVQEGIDQLHNARVVLEHCPPPSVCYAYLSLPTDVTTVGTFSLAANAATSVLLSLSSIELLLDSISAVPMAFYEATELEERERFLENCDFIDGSLGQGTPDEQFCLEVAVELSIHFYQSTHACACIPTGSAGEVCSVYGGQCPCVSTSDGFSRITGRQCDLCPFVTYLTPDGCAACGCPDPTESCAVSTGQCACPDLVTGRTCDTCMTDTFGDPTQGCSPCACQSTGTEECNMTTGECICKPGVSGVSCDQCEEGRFNLTSVGCEECACDDVGSEGSACDDNGQCSCKPGVGGLKCSSCLPSFFFFNSSGCSPCSCSGRTNTCTQDANITSEPSEVCSCPAPYVGASCEGCEEGWYLSDVTGDCEECSCNGLADTCLDGNGTCVGCQGNSTGAQCSVCLDGFYDSDPGPGLVCLPCPCSEVTAFDTLCSPDSSGNPVCNCRPGHEGQTCASCSDSYFGQPPLFRCTQCDCNGNIDPAVPGSCDTTTGRCLLCINNSTGDECENCISGYYGNATQQDCQPCDCNPEGSQDSLCDAVSGQCSCLPGVNGQRCEQCLPTYWNFTSSVGCQSCDCSGSIASESCDPLTGQCDCNPGVGGADCSYCLDGHYNLSSDGCSPCLCGEGAVNSSCTSDGQCYCQPGVGGAKCDLCEPFHSNLTSSGCEPCGECEQSLREDLEREAERLHMVTEMAVFLRQLSEADMEGLGEVERVRSELAEDVAAIAGYLEQAEEPVAAVNASYVMLEETVRDAEQRVEQSLSLTLTLQPTAEDVSNHIQQIYNQMQQGLVQLGDSTAYAETVEPQTAAQAVLAGQIQANVTAIAALHGGNFSDAVCTTQTAVERAEDVAEDVSSALSLAQVQSAQAADLVGQYEDIRNGIETVSMSVEETRASLERVEEELEEAMEASSLLSSDVEIVEEVISLSRDVLEETQQVLGDTRERADSVHQEIDQLEEWVGDVSSSGTASGLLEPGSGMESAEPETIWEGVASLQSVVGEVRVEVERCEHVVESAEEHADMLEQTAADIDQILSASLAAGGAAVEAILDYSDALASIEEAQNISSSTNTTVQQLVEEVRELDLEELRREAEMLRESSQELLDEAEEGRDSVAALVQEVVAIETSVVNAANQATSIRQRVQNLTERVGTLRTATETTASVVSLNLNTTYTALSSTSSAHSSLSSLLPHLLNRTAAALAIVTDTQVTYDLADSALNTANDTAAEAERALDERQPLLSEADDMRAENGRSLDSLTTSIDGLLQELERAREAAASIDIALRFYGNTSLGYTAPPTPVDPATRISLVFNPSHTTGLMLYSSAGTEEQQSVSLHLNNGSVYFGSEVGGADGAEFVSTPPGVVQDDMWYQLYATREGSTSQLSVSPLQGGTTHTSTHVSPSPPPLLLPPNGTIFLGGAPTHVQAPPSPVTTGYSGCLDRVLINNAQLSLLLPEETVPQPATCGPRSAYALFIRWQAVTPPTVSLHEGYACGVWPPAEASRAFESGAWLQGGGSYIQVNTPLITGASPLSVRLAFRTFATDGLLLQLFSEDMVQSLSLSLVQGRLYLELHLSSLDQTQLETVGVYNEGAWHYVEVELDGRNASLLVDIERVNGSALTLSPSFVPSSERFYLGGLPPHVQVSIGSAAVSLAGCVRELEVGGEAVMLTTNFSSARVSFDGCPEEVAAGVRFSGEGMAVFPPLTEELSHISFSFRSTQLASLLLAVGAEPSLVISLYHTRVRVDGLGSILESPVDALNDNVWHSVEVTLETGRMNLTVDGESVTTPTSGPLPSSGSDLVVGGVATPTDVPVAESFRGCLDQLEVNTMSVDFSLAQSLEGVSLYGCTPESSQVTTPIPPPPPPLPPPPSINPNISVGLDGQEGSFIAIPVAQEELATSYTIVLEFQTTSPNAMLLYTQGSYDFMALELMRGALHYTYNLGSGRVIITTSGTYNDGLEHTVELYRTAKEGTIVVDGGTEEVSGESPGSFTSLNVESDMLFVGGTPAGMPPTNLIRFRTTGEEIPPSALGCFLSLSINGEFVNFSSPQASSGTEDCRLFYSNLATFHGTGYLQLLDDFNGGILFTLSFEFRTSHCSGLLVYADSSTHPDHVALEMVDGVIRLIFDNGPGPSPLGHPPSTTIICDNEWHSLTVTKDGITGTLSLDGEEGVSMSSSNANFVSMDTNSPLFIGGVPAATPLRSGVTNTPFTGCIRNFYVSTSRTGPLERDLAQASQSSEVSFHTCTS